MSGSYQLLVMHPTIQMVVQRLFFNSKQEAEEAAWRKEAEGYRTHVTLSRPQQSPY